MTEAMPFLQKTILLSYDPRPFRRERFFVVNPHKRSSLFSVPLTIFSFCDPCYNEDEIREVHPHTFSKRRRLP